MSLKETLDAVKKAHGAPLPDNIAKAYTQGLGLVAYDLQAPALQLYPVLTPLRNKIPRVKGGGDTATRWKAITGINTANTRAGVSEGNRGAVITTTLSSYTAAYKGIGLEDNVTFEADYAAETFDDAKAKAVYGLLNSVMIQEERILFGGNASIALGTTPTPTPATATTGGTIAAATYNVICVALTHVAMREATVTGGVTVTAARTNADSSSDTVNGGHAAKSTAASQVTTGATSTISATVAVVNGAAGYAWYFGTAGSELLAAITYLNSVLLVAAPAGTQNASVLVGDKSQDALVYDGLLTQLFTSGSNSYNVALATGTAGTGTVMTTDGAGGINEIDTALVQFWNNYRLSPDEMIVSAKTLIAMNKLVIANGGAPLIRYMLDSTGNPTLEAGVVIGSYLNKAMNKKLMVWVHPEAIDGMITFYSNSIPYPLNGIGNILQVKTRKEYYQIEWPLRTRKYEYGVYADELLQCYFPPAFGILKNIAVG